MIKPLIQLLFVAGLGFFLARPAIAAPTISNIRDNLSTYSNQTVPLYEKLETSFDLSGLQANNFHLPFDNQTSVPGLATGVGVTVDGLFLPPSESDWNKALIQPAFYYQPTIKDTSFGGKDQEWIYPSGKAYWVIRFAPNAQGTWRYKIRVQDKSNAPSWTESATRSFNATTPKVGNHGFLKPSSRDSRYFEFTDGTPFHALSNHSGFVTEKTVEAEMQLYSQNGVNLYRPWMDDQLIFSRGTHGWNTWRGFDGKTSTEAVYPTHDFSIKFGQAGDFIAQYTDGNQYLSSSFEANKTYIVRLKAKLVNTSSSALQVKLLKDPYVSANNPSPFTSSTNVVQQLGPSGTSWKEIADQDGWKILESAFTNTRGRFFSSWGKSLAVGLNSNGTAYIDELYIGEDLGNGAIGPNVVFKGQVNYHLYYDPIPSSNWDDIFEHGKKYGVYLKPIITDKEDRILARLRSDGVYDPTIAVNGGGGWDRYHSARNQKSRRIQEYFWRYLAARWGYATSVHSWELLNEGDPGRQNHYDQANHLAETMDKFDRNHMTTTSFWSQFPTSFWTSTSSDYADVHAYVSTTYAYSCPGGTPSNPSLANELMNDSAFYHTWHSQNLIGKNVGKPIIRGEAGIDFPCKQDINPDLSKDTYGVWLHNYVWAQLHHGGLQELYWWAHDMKGQPGPDGDTANGLFEIYTPFKDFYQTIQINSGQYRDVQATLSNSSLVAVGQKNSASQPATNAHLWIRHQNYTWRNIINNQSPPRLSGSVTIANLKANTSFPVEWWQFSKTGSLKKHSTSIASNSQGVLTFSLDSLDAATTDVAIKIGTYAPGQPTPPPVTLSPTPKTGDFDADGDVDFLDFKKMLMSYDGKDCGLNLTGSSSICTVSIFDLNSLMSLLFN